MAFKPPIRRTLGGGIWGDHKRGNLGGHQGLSGSTTSLSEQFVRLVRGARGVAHPLRHAMLVSALYHSWDDFIHRYSEAISGIEAYGDGDQEIDNAAELGNRASTVRNALLQAVTDGTSVTAAARMNGVAVNTAMAWMASAGVQVKRRPKAMTDDLVQFATARLRQGASKSSIAAALKLSVQSVTRLMRTTPDLQATWHKAQFDRHQRIARRIWGRTAARLDPASPSLMRAMQPATFAWLYRNDRKWLQDFSENLVRMPISNNANVKWDERDTALVQLVRVSALDIAFNSPTGAVKLSQLCDRVDGLKRMLSCLNRLPLTRAAISIATHGRRSADINAI